MDIFTLILIAGGIIISGISLKIFKAGYFLLSAFCGIAALFAVDFAGTFFGYQVPVNIFTVSVSAVGGIPGIVMLTALRTYFGI